MGKSGPGSNERSLRRIALSALVASACAYGCTAQTSGLAEEGADTGNDTSDRDTSVVIDSGDVGDSTVVDTGETGDSSTDSTVDSGDSSTDSGDSSDSALDSDATLDSTPDAADTGTDVGDTGADADALTCKSPAIPCSGVCVDPTKDEFNCGGCGNNCYTTFARLSVCAAGPACACTGGAVQCPWGGGAACVDLAIDPNNCKTCGTGCSADQRCLGSKCECRPGHDICGSTTKFCTDLKGDRYNCGTCGKTCDSGEHCVNGTCGSSTGTCASGRTECDFRSCFDLKNDALHCGSCSNACKVDEACVGGNCRRYLSCAGASCADASCTASLGTTSKYCDLGGGFKICVTGSTCPTAGWL